MTPPIADARILVVDDQPANLMLLEALLQHWEYQNILTTGDSSQVVPMVEAEVPDLVLLDLRMPAPDGFELMRLLEPWTRGPERLPILVLTADATAETKRRALAAGARDFLTKPFDPTEVGLRVGNLLEIRRLHVELQRHNQMLEDRVRARTLELEQARHETLDRLVFAGEFRDDDPNQHAIVLLASYGKVDALLTADAESDITVPLRPPPVEILKVAHHGSADEGLPALLSLLRPAIAVVSVGEHNDYGHPTPSTMGALERAPRLAVFRTDRDGPVVVETDGEQFWTGGEG